MSRTKWVEVQVTVDMSDFDDEDILEEAKERQLEGFDSDEQITEMFYAFKLGRSDRAIELAKKIAETHTGMILC